MVLAIFMVTLVLPASACGQGGSDIGMSIKQSYNNVREWFIMQGANDRIEKIRKGDMQVMVVDDNGDAVRDARVYYEQQSHDFLFGSGLSPLGIQEGGPNAVDDQWAEAYTALFNYGTLPFYWDSYEQIQGQTNDQLLQAMADWARKRNIVTKGQPLVWADVAPSWLPPSVNDIQTAEEKHVKQIVGDFCGLVEYWDVVTEPTMGGHTNTPIGVWINTKTPAVVCVEALNWARSACPKATLIINDYRTDQDFRNILQDIIRQKGRFDAIGLQAHMHRGNWPLYQVWDICERFKDFNVPLHFTEVTVLSGAPKTGISSSQSVEQEEWPTTAVGEAQQAEYVEKLYTLLFSHPSVNAITWWDFSDRDAWQGAPAGLLRADMSKKPAYDSLLKLIKSTWWSFGNVYTDMDGTASFKGFYGSYKLTVQKEGRIAETIVYMTKGIDNKVQVHLPDYIQEPPTPLSEQIWPYVAAFVVIAIIVLIIRQILIIRQRI